MSNVWMDASPPWVAVMLAIALAGCASAPISPREYLDEHTAATITVVQQPWIFTRVHTNDHAARDFLHLYAIDVNRMGDHRQYFAALQSAPSVNAVPPLLELKTGEHILTLEPAKGAPRDLGIAQPIAESYTPTAAWWYFPVNKQTLAGLARAGEIEARLINPEGPIAYVLWRDGRDELSELTAVLP